MKAQTDLYAGFDPSGPAFEAATQISIDLEAHRLAIYFTDSAELPTRLRKRSESGKQKKKTKKRDSEVEKRFKKNVQEWRSLIETMLERLPLEQAWRFIRLAPRIDKDAARLTDNPDFHDLMEYLILRRDKEECGAAELGCLAQLSTAFQREIERHLEEGANAAKIDGQPDEMAMRNLVEGNRDER